MKKAFRTTFRRREKDAEAGTVSPADLDHLVKAVQNCDNKGLNSLLKERPSLANEIIGRPYNTTLLQLACRLNPNTEKGSEILRTLLNFTADPNARGPRGLTALHAAAQTRNSEAMNVLLSWKHVDQKVDVNSVDESGNSALHLLAKTTSTDGEDDHLRRCVGLLLDREEFDAYHLNQEKLSAAAVAAFEKNLALLDTLLSSTRFKVDLLSLRDQVVLMDRCPNLIIKLPLAKSIKRVFEAALQNNDETQTVENLRELLRNSSEYQEDLQLILNSTFKSLTLLQYSCEQGMVNLAGELLMKGADPISFANGTVPPIASAAINGHEAIVRLLLDSEAIRSNPVNNALLTVLKQQKFHSPSNYAKERCFELILDAIGDDEINLTDEMGNTPLHFAAIGGNGHYVQKLLIRGAYLASENKFGKSPLRYIEPEVLKAYLDQQVAPNVGSVVEAVQVIKYSFLVPPSTAITSPKLVGKCSPQDQIPQLNVLIHMSKSKDLQQYLKHPVILTFLHLKWLTIKRFYYSHLISFACFVNLMTWFMLFGQHAFEPDFEDIVGFNHSYGTEDSVVGNYTKRNAVYVSFSHSLAFVGTTLCIISFFYLTTQKIFEFCIMPTRYFSTLERTFEVIVLVLFAAFLLDSEFEDNFSSLLAAVAILMAWCNLFLAVSKLPIMSTYIGMMKTVALNFLWLVGWCSPLISAFAFSFYVLFKDADGDNFFLNLSSSYFKTFVMLTGEFDTSNIPFQTSPLVSHLIFLFFVFILAIIFFNLSIGIAVNDIQEVRSEAEILGYVYRLKLVSRVERGSNKKHEPRKIKSKGCSNWFGKLFHFSSLYPDEIPKEVNVFHDDEDKLCIAAQGWKKTFYVEDELEVSVVKDLCRLLHKNKVA